MGDVQRTDRLSSYREQGTMGVGTVLAQKGHALLSCWSLESAPTLFPIISLPNLFLKSTLCKPLSLRGLVPCHPTLKCSPRSRSWARPAILANCSHAQGARTSLGETQAIGVLGRERAQSPR